MMQAVMKEQFFRAGMLLGEKAMETLSGSHVAVFGLGGVGSWCAEALARSGVGTLTLVDSDAYSVTNINRQSEALWKNNGRAKAAVLAERLKEIHPEIKLHVWEELYNAESRDKFFPAGECPYSFVADCIDLVSCKLDLIETCRERGIPLISSMGTGNKKDAQLLQITDISKTYGDALARVMRKELRARGVEHLPVVFSPEEPIKPMQTEVPPPGRRSIPGSRVWVTASAGMLMSQHNVLSLINNRQ